MNREQAAIWHQTLPLRFLLPLLLVLSATSIGNFFYSEALLERVILEQVKKQAEMMLIGMERQIQGYDNPYDREQLESLFEQVLADSHRRYPFSIDKIYLYRDNGEVVAHSDQHKYLSKSMNGKYGEVIRSGQSHLAGPVENKVDPRTGKLIRSTDIIIPLSINGEVSAALEAELDLAETENIISSIDDEFEAMMRLITLASTLIIAVVFLIMLWTQLIRPARAYEQALQVSIDEGKALNRAKDDFLSSMSHELRTPLTTIIGYHQFMLDGKELPTRYKNMIEDCLLAGQTLQQLVNDLLDMSKIRSGKFELNHQPFDLHQVIHDITRLMESYNPEKEVSLKLEIDPQLTPLLKHRWIGDAMRLSQVLFNLLSNAIKFSHSQGEVMLRISQGRPGTATDTEEIFFQLQIEDRGIGISEETLERLFAPFEQADSSTSRRFGGTGLGLYISCQLIELMGGSISVDSKVGRGSLFTVEVPLKRGEAIDSISAETHTQSSALPALQGTILLAEDTRQIQRLVRLMVEQTGATIEIANNGIEAVEKGEHGDYQLILMDMQMPEMDGIEATRQLRQRGCSTPILALTANVMQRHRDAFEAAGCDGFLSKPIEPEQLYHQLNHYLLTGTTPAATPPAPTTTLIDQEMMEEFWEDLIDMEQTLRQDFATANWKGVAHTAHSIKGMGSSFGQPQLTQLAEALHSACQQPETTPSHFDALIQLLQQQNPLKEPHNESINR